MFLRRSQWHDYFVTIIASSSSSSSSSSGEEDNVREIILDDDNNKNKNFDLSSASSFLFKQHEEKEEEEDIFEVIRENLPFFIGGMVAGTFGLSITDDSSPLKGWVEDRKKSSMSSLSQNNKLVEPSPSSIRIRQEEEAVFTVPTTKTTLENNNNDNISSTE